ncbi:hypothetical protein PYW07_009145 [Mythimna separata]|uniref:Zinc finger PHD-type domain-containing protein n=1 Tax=Mythimna separata TaxID=271217 RepID=A0AAD7YBF0_MYTSE|nr:hypothetical protein PYW07_009145 [Mythimna separata]
MPGAKCGGCGRFISTLEGAKCGKCQMVYHRVCVGVPTKANVALNWRCPECKKNVVRDNRPDTPVRGSIQSPTKEAEEDPAAEATSTPSNFGASSRAEVSTVELSPVTGSDLGQIMKELRALREDIHMFRREMEVEMAELKSTLGTCNTRIDSLEARVDVLEMQASSVSATSVDRVVEELRRELNDRDQDLLSNDIEVSNLPEHKAENTAHIVLAIGRKLGVAIEGRDIVSAERVGGRQLNVSGPTGATEARPRVVVVRLARRDLRDQLLTSARVRRGATTADLDLPGPAQRFYLNERLTKTNRQLFRRVRDAANLHGWRFVWTKQGRILARRTPADRTQRIRTEEDLSRIFGSANDTA